MARKSAMGESRKSTKGSHRGTVRNGSKEMRRSISTGSSKDRRGSRSASGSRTGSKTPVSVSGSIHPAWEDSSSSEDLNEDDFAGCDPRKIPLHLRTEEMIAKSASGMVGRKSQMIAFYTAPTKEMEEQQALATQKTLELEQAEIKAAMMRTPEEEEEDDDTPKASVTMDQRVIVVSCGLCLVWALLACASLGFFAWRFFSSVRGDFQRFVAEAALLEMETAGVAALTPAASLVRAFALSAQAGLLNGSTDAYKAVSQFLTVEMLRAPDILRVQVFNATARAIVVTPGDIHNLTRRAYGLRVATAANTFDVDVSLDDLVRQLGQQLAPAPKDGASVAWTGPEWLHVGPPRSVPLEEDFQLAYRLVALTYDTTAQRGAPPFAVDVAIGLSSLAETARRVRPSGGEVYVCTGNGALLAGSNWDPTAIVGNATGPSSSYARLWDLPMAWAQGIDRQIIRSSSPAEGWHARDLIAARPIASMEGECSVSMLQPALRAVVVAPQDAAISPILGQLALAGVGLAACPPAVAVLFLIGWCLFSCLTCCRRRISTRLEQRRFRKLCPDSEVM